MGIGKLFKYYKIAQSLMFEEKAGKNVEANMVSCLDEYISMKE